MTPPGSVSIARRAVRKPAPAAGRLLFCRHGHTKLNAGMDSPDRIRGWQDVPLDASGKREAKEIGALFTGVPVEIILTSDLSRAEETGRQIARQAGGAPRQLATRGLRPWDLGEYTGKPTREVIPAIHQRYVKQHPDEAVPGGESFTQFKTRFLGVVTDALACLTGRDGATIVLVCHYRNLKTVEAWVAAGGKGQKLDLPVFFADNLYPGALYEVIPRGGTVTGERLFAGFPQGTGPNRT